MSDLIELAKKAVNPEFDGEEYIIAGYIKDFARALIAAEQTAGNPDWVAARIREFDGNHEKGAGAIGEYVATAFRAAMEGRTND